MKEIDRTFENRRLDFAQNFARIDLQWFAAEDEGRTEEPSEYTLRKEREKGRVPQSQELPGAVILFVLSAFIFFFGGSILRSLVRLLRHFFGLCGQKSLSAAAAGEAALEIYARIVLPFLAICIVVGIVASVAQTRGFVISAEPVKPNLSRIVPNFGKFFKQTLISRVGMFNVLKTWLKIIAIVAISYLTIFGERNRLINLINVSPSMAMELVGHLAAKILFFSSAFLVAIAVVDFIVQRWQFMEEHKMTKSAVKEEMKETEGSPEVKSWIMGKMRALMSQNLQKSVSQADFVVTNPTHFACAIEFEADTMNAPTLTAKGADLMAQRIKEIARESGIVIIENKPLARALYANVEIGQEIPEQYFKMLVGVFTEVSRIDKTVGEKWARRRRP